MGQGKHQFSGLRFLFFAAFPDLLIDKVEELTKRPKEGREPEEMLAQWEWEEKAWSM